MASKKIYTYSNKKHTTNRKEIGWMFLISGVGIIIFFAFPIIFWKLIKEPDLVQVLTPLARTREASPGDVLNNEQFNPDNYTYQKDNWILGYNFQKKLNNTGIDSYFITIPKIGLKKAVVSTVDDKITDHLVQYWGTPLPPLKGNTVIFGHSTMPQLFNPNDYKTIFAHIYDLNINDEILVIINSIQYEYKVTEIFTTQASDLSVLDQSVSGSYITFITCTPPGTTWRRLIIKAKYVK